MLNAKRLGDRLHAAAEAERLIIERRAKRKAREARKDAIDSRVAAQRLRSLGNFPAVMAPYNNHLPGTTVILVGDIVTGFEAYGPFESGHDAITWKQSAGNREMCQGQWYLMQLKPPIPGKD